MLTVSVKADIAQAQRALSRLQKDQIPFATAYALTQSAKAAQREVEREIVRQFDRPTPFTMKSVFVRSATKRTLEAEVKIKDEASKRNRAQLKFLGPAIQGGPRSAKGFEVALRRARALPFGWYAVPTQWAPKDAYGNVPGGVIVRILSQLQAGGERIPNETTELARRRNSKRNRSKRRLSRYFAVMPDSGSHLKPGIYERVTFGFGAAIRPVFVYTPRAPRYAVRLRFEKIVLDTVRAQIGLQFRRGAALAARTAR